MAVVARVVVARVAVVARVVVMLADDGDVDGVGVAGGNGDGVV